MSDRPGVLLQDHWGADRPATDAEIARAARLTRRDDLVFIAVCGAVMVAAVAVVAGLLL